MDAKRREVLNSFGLLVLRAGIGIYLMTHGWGKVQMLVDGNTDAFGDPIGIGSVPSVALVAFAEFLCALLVVVGLVTRVAAIPVVINMAVAAFVAHAEDPWTMGAGASKEPALLYLIPFLALVFTGPGKVSLDAAIFRKKSPPASKQPKNGKGKKKK